MAHRLDSNETVSWEEISYSNMMQQEALIRILVRKGILSQKEFLDELKQLQKEMANKKIK